MTTTDIVVRGNVDLNVIPLLSDFATQISQSDFVPANLRNKPGAILACMMTGQEMGIPPMQALRQIDVIDGRPAQRAELMRAMIMNAGHEFWFGEGAEYTATRVVAYGRRKGESTIARVEWTIDQARTAGLAGKKNWKENPRAMLVARSTSELSRIKFPDVIAGMGYTAEELNDGDPLDDEIVEGEIVDAPTSQKRTAPARKAKKAAPKKETSPPPRTAEPALPGEEDEEEVEIVDTRPPAEREAPTEPEQTQDQKVRSVQIVKLAKALGVDHHPVVNAVTNGVTSSARLLDPEQAIAVMDAIRAINDGRAKVMDRGDGTFAVYAIDFDGSGGAAPLGEGATSSPAESSSVEDDDDVIDAEIVEDDEDEEDEVPDPESWDADAWRAYLNAKSVKVIQVIRRSAKTTPQGQTPVGNLAGIAGSGQAATLKAWVDEGAPE